MSVIKYGKKEIEYLRQKDKKLGAYIERRGKLKCETFPDVFEALVSSIVTQQISTFAAEAIDRRIHEKFSRVTPEALGGVAPEELRALGLSIKKSEYILGLAELVRSGKLDLGELFTLSDEEAARKLLPVKGIGPWTVEMLLIFTLERPDVVSWGDLAIRRGVMNLYGIKELTKEKFDRLCRRWSPYGTVASLYLWEAAVDKSLTPAKKTRAAGAVKSGKGSALLRKTSAKK